MTNLEYRLFMDEIYFLESKKEFSGNFNIMVLLLKRFKSPKQILEGKRKAYDFAIASLFWKYEIANETLYEDLAGIWQSIDQFELSRKFIVTTVMFDIVSALEIRHVFVLYKQRVQKYCDNYVKSLPKADL